MARPQKVSDEEIAEATREAVLEHGPGVSVALVAERLGVTHAALFQRMGTKEKLLQLALDADWASAIAPLHAPPDDERSPHAQLDAMLAGLAAFLRGVVPLAVMQRAADMRREMPVGVEPPPVALRRLLARWLKRANAMGLVDVESPSSVAEALLGALEARCFNAFVGGEHFAPGDDRRVLRKLVRALVPRVDEDAP